MANFYAGSVQYDAVAQWSASTPVAVGAIVRQLATVVENNKSCFVCTTAGTTGAAEPAWVLSPGSNTNDNGVVWREVTGEETHSWAAPFASFAGAYPRSKINAGDTVFVASNDARAASANLVLENRSHTGTPQVPVIRYISVNPLGSVPPVLADMQKGATVETTLGFLRINGSGYYWGLHFKSPATGVSSIQLMGNSETVLAAMEFENCDFESLAFQLGAPNAANLELRLHQSTFKYLGAAGLMTINGRFIHLYDCPSFFAPGSFFPTNLFVNTADATNALIEGCDLSGVTGAIIQRTGGSNQMTITVANCKTSAAFTTPLTGGVYKGGVLADFINVGPAAGAANVQSRIWAQADLDVENTIRLDATDGLAPYSWKIATTTLGDALQSPFEAFEMAQWNTDVGAPKTITVELLTDNVSLLDSEVWMEVQYPGDPASPLSSTVSTYYGPLGTGAALAASTAPWVTTGLGSPLKQKLTATITPQLAGDIRVGVRILKASTTIYMNPKFSVT